MRIVLLLSLALTSMFAFAQGAPEDTTFFQGVADLIAAWGGFDWFARLSAILTLALSAVKTSFLRVWWDKLGDLKFWAAPVISIVVGLLSMGGSITFEAVMAYFASGLGAVALHELLDLIKKLPKIGPTWVAIIEFLKSMLGAPPTAIGSFILGFFAVSMLFTTSGCTGKDPACEVAKLVAKPVAAGLGHLASCKNPSALEPWLIDRIKAIKPDLCTAPSAKSIVGEIICPSLIEGVIGGGIGLLPKEAQCSGGTLAETAKAELLKLCKESI